MEVQEGLANPFQQKLGFTQMLRVFRVDTSNTYISVSIFERQGPFSQVWSHMVKYYPSSNTLISTEQRRGVCNWQASEILSGECNRDFTILIYLYGT